MGGLYLALELQFESQSQLWPANSRCIRRADQTKPYRTGPNRTTRHDTMRKVAVPLLLASWRSPETCPIQIYLEPIWAPF